MLNLESKGATVKRGPKLSGLMNPDGFQKDIIDVADLLK